MEKNKSSPSQEFLEKKELVELEMKATKLKHRCKMEGLAYMRASDLEHHERELTRGRIKSAEIRKTIAQKSYR